MIGFFETFEDLQNWARGRAEALDAEHLRTGNLITLGYAMAMHDIVRSEMGAGVTVPAYQRACEVEAADVIPFPVASDRAAA